MSQAKYDPNARALEKERANSLFASVDLSKAVILGHRQQELRSVHLHEVAMKKALERPELIEKIIANCTRLKCKCGPEAAHIFTFWDAVIVALKRGEDFTLDGADELVLQALQFSPFAGVLSPEERIAAMEEWKQAQR